VLEEEYNQYVETTVRNLKGKVRQLHHEGRVADALESARECVGLVERHFGKQHPVFASSINDLAVLLKANGELEEATEQYTIAVQLYTDLYGAENPSTAIALHNLGLCYNANAEVAQGMDQLMIREQAKAAFEDALASQKAVDAILATMDGDAERAAQIKGQETTALTMASLAGVLRELKQPEKAGEMLVDALALLEQQGAGEEILGTPSREIAKATVLNNLGYHHRHVKQLEDAAALYIRALDIRVPRLGKVHHDTIATRHNLAEVLLLMGKDDAAHEVQQGILHDLGALDNSSRSD